MTQNMVKVTDKKKFEKQYSQQLNTMILKKDFKGFAAEILRICNIITFEDFNIDEPFINFIRTNDLPTYGNDELRAYGKAYFIDWTREQLQEKEIDVACGKKAKIKFIICNEPFDSQVPDAYLDYLTKNIDKQITFFLDRDEVRNLACGDNTFNAIVNLLNSKIQTATFDLIYDTIICAINNPINYKQIVEIPYCCDKCDGQNPISALNTFMLKMQRNNAQYNIHGRDYTLPIRQMMLLKSYELDSRLMSILSNTFNDSRINIETKFNQTFTLDLTIADGVISDVRWPKYKEILNEFDWEYSFKKRGNCGIGNYVAKFALVKFLVAVPFKLVKISCEEKNQADNWRSKIEAQSNVIVATDQSTAETAIKKIIDDNKPTGTKLTAETEYSDFTAPTDDKDGAITATTQIKDESGNTLENFTINYVLKKEKKLSDVITSPNLGEISFAGDNPTETELTAILRGNYPVLASASLKYENITSTSATVSDTSGQYTGNVNLTYTKKAAFSTKNTKK